MNPKYLEVKGKFTPRGGISITPFANYADEQHQDLKQKRLAAELAEYYMEVIADTESGDFFTIV